MQPVHRLDRLTSGVMLLAKSTIGAICSVSKKPPSWELTFFNKGADALSAALSNRQGMVCSWILAVLVVTFVRA